MVTIVCSFPPEQYFYMCFSFGNVPQYWSVFEAAFHCPSSGVGVLQIAQNTARSSGRNLSIALKSQYLYVDTKLRISYKAHFSFLFLKCKLKLLNTKETTEIP